MLMRKFATTSALLIAALGVSAGAVHAEPADAPVHYKATATDTAAVLQIDGGSMAVEDGAFKIKSAEGVTLAGTELKFRVDDFEFPVAADITGHTAALTPQLDLAHAVYKPVDLPFQNTAPWKTPYDREQAAWNRMKDTISLGATVGTLVGGLGGGAVGCALGAIAVGTGATLATGVIGGLFSFLPGAAVGCLVGAAAMGALGVLAGQLLVTAPVAIVAAVQYFTTVDEPFVAAPK
ncbi:hypothetical protein [Nocardia terpenica]|uniref:DUF8020 domain-containing protein n=1 Tax=Nocardia terpenica TaxID=455432 RepID=A0A291RD23_9NOCA|nr:hypothetical protein [Nocardia terpenica]ATL65012.1 hypothetical protein CRH09_00935 [Nocardia terpenica]